MMRKLILTILVAMSIVAAASAEPGAALDPSVPAAPDIAGNEWINSAPLTLAQLRGSVVLVEFWTYSCGNCLRVLPYISQWHERYAGRGLVVIGVHTPEFDFERVGANVRAAVERLHIRFPVVQDNDYRIWSAWGNQFWPALYLIDRQGRIVYHRFGEGNYVQTEAEIRAQLAANR